MKRLLAAAIVFAALPAAAARTSVRSAADLQRAIDSAAAGATIVVSQGRYVGNIVVSRPVRLVGEGRPLLVSDSDESVVRITAPDVTFEGFDIDGAGLGDLGRDSSGVHVAAPRSVVRDCRISGTLFGVYLRAADDATVENCVIRGIPGKAPGEKGSGIHVWNTQRFRIAGNRIADVRDGMYIQSSSHGHISGNDARDLRYGLHYMFSDDNVFYGNTFANGDAGTAIMYSNRIVFRRNRFVHNRGFASVGLLFKNCEDVTAEENLIADNARGIFLEGSYRNVFRRNIIAESDAAIILYDSCANVRFEGNSFFANMTPLTLVGRRTDTKFDGNYWSDNHEPDLDGDGRSDRPYRLSSAFDHFRGNVAAADLFAEGPAAAAIAAAEETFPILDPIPVEDHAPLIRAPELAGVPRPQRVRRTSAFGFALSGALLAAGALALFGGSRRPGRDAKRADGTPGSVAQMRQKMPEARGASLTSKATVVASLFR